MNSKLLTLFLTLAATIVLVTSFGCGGGGGGSSDGGNGGGTGTTSGYSGRVVREDTFVGVSNVQVEIRNAGGGVIGTATTNSSGNFSIDLGAGAAPARFHLKSASIPTGYYKQYEYNTKRYTALDSTCSAPLPTFVANVITPLTTNIVVTPQNLPPPPPPNGCGL